MKVYTTIVDTNSGQYQFGMIDEPVKEGLEILNAIKHFGINDVFWINKSEEDNFSFRIGVVTETTKVVSVICVGQDMEKNNVL